VLVTPALQASDGAFLHRAAGVVSTGGGILSHAALLAAQFHKPAIIVEGRWESGPDGALTLHYSSTEFQLEEKKSHGYHIWSRKQVRERGHVLREGDLVALDANEDVLRVLGQERDTLALHEGFRQFGRASLDLARATNDQDILVFRGRRIRARHEIGKVLTRLADPMLACHAVHELLLDSEGMGRNASGAEKAQLMNLILHNAQVAKIARTHLRWTVRELRQRFEKAIRNARKRIPDSTSLYEVLSLRLDALRASGSLNEVGPCLAECGFDPVAVDGSLVSEIDRSTRRRLEQLREGIAAALRTHDRDAQDDRRRHLLGRWERSELLVGAPDEEKRELGAIRARLSESDDDTRTRLSGRTIIRPEDGGLELYPLIGWKGANLAEIGRITGRPAVPPWFAVTDRAFRQVLDSPVGELLPGGAKIPAGASTMRRAIEAILVQAKPDHLQKSAQIRGLWESIVLPAGLAGEIVEAYRRLPKGEPSVSVPGAGDPGDVPGESDPGEGDPGDSPGPLVALRSSSHEEDTEAAARAGEFDTFLFIRGEKQLLDYLLRTWSGLWSDRALHARAMIGTAPSFSGGGVIVQRMVNSRVSGVVQTINVARNEFREIVINAGLGLGEGIVSGTVAADQVVVSKEGDLEHGALRFSYVTADKQEYIVFNKRAGAGTMRCEPPYHQRMRPALEYPELCDLVGAAVRLEAAYGYPLDIEFGIEDDRLWILQARPVPASYSCLQETLNHHPLSEPDGEQPQ
jgi:hypothetical protein